MRAPSCIVESRYDEVVGVEHPDVLVRAVVGDGGHESFIALRLSNISRLSISCFIVSVEGDDDGRSLVYAGTHRQPSSVGVAPQQLGLHVTKRVGEQEGHATGGVPGCRGRGRWGG